MISSELLNNYIYPILDMITKEYGYEWGVVPRQEDENPYTLRIHFADMKNHLHLTQLFDLSDVVSREKGYLLFPSKIRTVLNEWNTVGELKEEPKNKYRDILIDQIKRAGQQLIDRAEEMVSKDLTYVTGFSINIDIPQPSDEPTSISWTTKTVNIHDLGI